MKKITTFLKLHPVVTMLISMAIAMLGLYVVPDGGTPWSRIANRLIFTTIMFAIMAAVGGWAVIRPKIKGFGYAFRMSAYTFIFMIAASLATMAPLFAGEAQFNPNWLAASAGMIVFALFVGLFEESLMRGIILNGLLAKTKGGKKGILAAVIISSLLFGFLHIFSTVIGGGITDLSTLWEATQKVFQTGAFGFIMAAIYLKTRNIWAVSIIHAINDIIPFVANSLMTNVPIADEMSDVVAKIITTSATIQPLFFIPMIIIGVVVLKKIKIPQKGFFVDKWTKSS